MGDTDRERETGSEDYVGDSPGEPFEMPADEPVAVDAPGTTAVEQGQRSLERRLAMEEPDLSAPRGTGPEGASVGPILDEDLATDELVTEDPRVVPEETDRDRTSEEVGELSSDPPESAEEAAVHIEPE